MQEIRRRADEENRDLTAEERQAWDAAETDLDEASSDIERFERAARLDEVDRDDVVSARGNGGGEDSDQAEADRRYAAAFRRYLTQGISRLSNEDRDLLMGAHVELESRAQTSGADTAGGFLVPDSFRNKFVDVMKAFGGIAQYAETLTTDTGADLPWIGMDDTGNEGEFLGENDEVTEQDVKFTGRKLKAHIVSSKMVKFPFALLQDSAVDVDGLMSRKLGERIGRRSARAWITGTGVDQPEGILSNAVVGKTGANGQTTSVTYDDLVDLEHAVDPAYRNSNSRYVFHDQTLKVLRKLKDADQRPLWIPVPAAGMPATINGRAYAIDNSMPVPAANAASIIFGDIRSAYVIRLVRGVTLMRLNERYAERMQAAFLSFARLDGSVQDRNAYRVYQHSAA
ncbi:phage major capsid protein [Micromonospora sp. HSS6-12]|uniref:Phage major capsid protein n=2 Tax=Micromonospora thermarum TaxID=2720024 RepID=A0ABX0ZBN1_9ACTN|nr:phage major capsid protein [Micromonospora thermarum]